MSKPAPSATAPSTAPALSQSKGTSTAPRRSASEELAALESKIAELVGSGETAKRLVKNAIALQSERLECNGSWAAILETMTNEDGSPAWGRRLGFARRIQQVVPETLRRLEDTRLTGFGRVLVAWQATVGIVMFWEEGADVVFSREEHRIAGALGKTPEAKKAFDEDRRRARPAPAPKSAPAPRHAAPDIDAILTGGGKKGEAKPAAQPPRGERGGNRGHGSKGSPSETPSLSKGPTRSETDEDDDRQPPADAHKATTLLDAVVTEAQALASGDRRRR